MACRAALICKPQQFMANIISFFVQALLRLSLKAGHLMFDAIAAQLFLDGLAAPTSQKCLRKCDEAMPTPMSLMPDELEAKHDNTVLVSLEEELKINLSDEVYACMQQDLESELLESMRNDLIALCEDRSEDPLNAEPAY